MWKPYPKSRETQKHLILASIGLVYDLQGSISSDPYVQERFGEALTPAKHMLMMFVGLSLFRDIKHLFQAWGPYRKLQKENAKVRANLRILLAMMSEDFKSWRERNSDSLRFFASQMAKRTAQKIRMRWITERMEIIERLKQSRPDLLVALMEYSETEKFQALLDEGSKNPNSGFRQDILHSFGVWLHQSPRNNLMELRDEVLKAKRNLEIENYQRNDPFSTDRLSVWGQLSAASIYGVYLAIGPEATAVDHMFFSEIVSWVRSQGENIRWLAASLVLGTYFYDVGNTVRRRINRKYLSVEEALARSEEMLEILNERNLDRSQKEFLSLTGKFAPSAESSSEMVERLLEDRQGSSWRAPLRCSRVWD